ALARQLAEAARLEADPTGSRSRGAKPGSPFAPLEPYVINLTNGRLSQSGDFTTDLVEDLEEIFDFHLPAYCRVAESQGRIPRMMIHAHGGLNNEKAALRYALSVHRWWLQLGVYPLYFLWETGFLESFQQRALAEPGTRDFFDHTTDPAFEHLTAGLGGAAWRRMKDNAERCSSPDLGDGVRGGAFLFAERLARFLADGQSLEIHAVGHSAGAVFHAHFLSLLAGVLSVPVATYSLLAPAARVELFKAKTLPLAQAGKIGKLALFSMDKQHEKADSVGGIYRKSLLYLVSRAFEGGEVTPLVGLQEDVLRDPQLVAAFVAPTGEVHWSPSPVSESPRLTLATAHGDFDNDAATMESVARRVLG
ncbi:MAG TPA: hypothetical protein PK413_21165, partial [Thermoanaerobaculia bacterium]|nr:hypothetical protein [Thermoanaerobaculia bacterium]